MLGFLSQSSVTSLKAASVVGANLMSLAQVTAHAITDEAHPSANTLHSFEALQDGLERPYPVELIDESASLLFLDNHIKQTNSDLPLAEISLASLDGANGFAVLGEEKGDSTGFSVSSAGDVNRDGFLDVVIGAPHYVTLGNSGAGKSYLVFGGNATEFKSFLDLSMLDGTNGSVLTGEVENDKSGYSVSYAGDVNGDGFSDVVIGAPYADPGDVTKAGKSYVIFGKEPPFEASVALSSLDGINGFSLTGEVRGDESGWSVSGAGDVNGDGFSDVVIGAPLADSGGMLGAGKSYVVFGKESSFEASIGLSSLDGANGFVLTGQAEGDWSGYSVGHAGDINGDGFDDVIIGVPQSYLRNVGTGKAYVVFGQESPFETSIALSSLNGINGFALIGEVKGDRAGWSVGGAGDVNGDGFSDVVIGAFYADPDDITRAGKSYVVFGKESSFEASVALSSLDGVNGFMLIGQAEGDKSGQSVSGAGDVNGDGFSDVVIGAPNAHLSEISRAGKSYVIFGKDSLFEASVALSSLDGINGFVLAGQAEGDNSGQSVSGAGDVNGDGFSDMVIGAPFADPSENDTDSEGLNNAGKSYIVFGEKIQTPISLPTPTPTPVSSMLGEIGLSSIDDINGVVLRGEVIDGTAGWSVSGAGDMNGDGFSDVIIGAPCRTVFAASGLGKAYVIFGRRLSFEPLDLSQLDGINGFELIAETEDDGAGMSVSDAGDMNGDGFSDIIIGAPLASLGDATEAGKSYVVFGKESSFEASIALSSLNGKNGFALIGEVGDWSGYSVSGAGDVNADGFSDVIIGAIYADSGGVSGVGKSYVVFGKQSPFESSFALSSLDGTTGFVLIGQTKGENSGYSVSGAGDVNADGFSDVVIGAPWAAPGGVSRAGKGYVVFGKSSFESSLALLSLDGTNGFALIGEAQSGWLGQSASGAGDVNGDGFSDVVIGAPRIASAGISMAGKSYVVFGKASCFEANFALSSLDGANGFVLTGQSVLDESGRSVSNAGDVNGDGFSDVVIGAPYASSEISRAGKSYVVFGKNSSFGASFALSSLDGANGFVLTGEAVQDYAGLSVSGAGDVNGDGFSDVVIGAPWADPNDISRAGKSYVAFGGLIQVQAPVLPSPPPPTPAPSVAPTPSVFETDLSNLDGANGLTIAGEVEADHVGYSVSGAGDMNGDGFDDVIIGAPYSDTHGIWSGKSYVVFGNASIAESMLDLATIETDATRGFVLAGEASYDYLGFSVAHAGDVNHDGIDDVIIGAYRADTNSANSGKAYVVFGSRLGFGLPLDLSRLDGNNGFALLGEAEFDGLGYSVNAAGDMNGDKVDDVVVGAPFASTTGLRSGKSYVVFGSALGFESSFSLSSLDGSNGFALLGEASGDWLGFSVSGAGDVNGDGIDDVILGAPSAKLNGNGVGKSYVVFGRVSGFESSLGLSSLDGINGFTVPGETEDDMFGYSVGGIGDMNGDGFDDVIIGAPDAVNKIEDVEVETGKGYVIFGKDTQFDKFFTLANLNGRNGFVVIGGAEGDRAGYSVSGAGDVNGDGFSDVIIGAPLAGEEEPGAGKSYVILGKRTGFSASIGLSALGSNGFVLTGAETGDRAGYSVSGAGDVNGDGADDVLIGAPFSDVDSEGVEDVGASYVVFGDSPSPTPTSSLSSGQIAGIAVGAVAGLAVVGAIGKFGFWDRYVSDDPAREPLIQQARPVMP